MRLPMFGRPRAEDDPIREALDLRERYGEDAEAWCDISILATDALTRRRSLYRVRDALRMVSNEDVHA